LQLANKGIADGLIFFLDVGYFHGIPIVLEIYELDLLLYIYKGFLGHECRSLVERNQRTNIKQYKTQPGKKKLKLPRAVSW
jgi:hypothetical protein